MKNSYYNQRCAESCRSWPGQQDKKTKHSDRSVVVVTAWLTQGPGLDFPSTHLKKKSLKATGGKMKQPTVLTDDSFIVHTSCEILIKTTFFSWNLRNQWQDPAEWPQEEWLQEEGSLEEGWLEFWPDIKTYKSKVITEFLMAQGQAHSHMDMTYFRSVIASQCERTDIFGYLNGEKWNSFSAPLKGNF